MIRKIREEDISSVIDIMLRNWDKVLSKHHSEAVLKKFRSEITPAWIMRQMEWKQIWVIEEDDRVVATGALANFGTPDIPRLSVSQFFVQPELHGRGIGKSLINYLVQVAFGQGYPRLHVPSSQNAIPFYKSAGFTVDTNQPDMADEITWMSMEMNMIAEHA